MLDVLTTMAKQLKGWSGLRTSMFGVYLSAKQTLKAINILRSTNVVAGEKEVRYQDHRIDLSHWLSWFVISRAVGQEVLAHR